MRYSCALSFVVASIGCTGQLKSENRPIHGLELSYALHTQFAGQVTSNDGSHRYVAVSQRASGFQLGARYSYDVSERTGVLLGLQAGRTSFNFSWSGDPTPLGNFAAPDGRKTTFTDHWESRALVLFIETELRKRRRSSLLATAGTLLMDGSGSSSFVRRVESDIGTVEDVFRYSALFNPSRRLMTGFSAGLVFEKSFQGFNRIRLGIVYNALLGRDNLSGTYLVRSISQSSSSGRFSSSLSSIGLQAGYMFSWGYPKMPKRLLK